MGDAAYSLIRRSIPLLLIDDVAQLLAGGEAGDVLFVKLDPARRAALALGGDVRRDDHVLELPQRVPFGKRLGVGDVDAGSGQMLAIEGFDERAKIVDLSA